MSDDIILYTYNGDTRTLEGWARKLGISVHAMAMRLQHLSAGHITAAKAFAPHACRGAPQRLSK